MDNNELALALREQDLDKVAVYLSRCGQSDNHDLVSLGYPDIGWDPVEGERFLDFLRFCVWVNGELRLRLNITEWNDLIKNDTDRKDSIPFQN